MRLNLLITGLVLACFAAFGQTREIRLRNGVIATPSVAKTASATQSQSQASAVPISSLYLIQLENHLTPAERIELQMLGVKLLKYVPDDAFIARLNNVSPDRVRALAFVRWVGIYQADYKIEARLTATAHGALMKSQAASTNVSVLIASGATAAEIAGVSSFFLNVQHKSDLRFGTVLQGRLNLARLPTLAQSSSVLWVETAPKRKLVDEAASKIVGGDDGHVGTPTVTEQLGFNGAGVTVCVADTGLDTGDTNTMHPDLLGTRDGVSILRRLDGWFGRLRSWHTLRGHCRRECRHG